MARIRAEDQLQRGIKIPFWVMEMFYIDCDMVTQFYTNATIYDTALLNELHSIETLL